MYAISRHVCSVPAALTMACARRQVPSPVLLPPPPPDYHYTPRMSAKDLAAEVDAIVDFMHLLRSGNDCPTLSAVTPVCACWHFCIQPCVLPPISVPLSGALTLPRCPAMRTASEFSAMFKQQVLDRKVRTAESTIHRDFAIIRKVGDRMGLMGAKKCFDAWVRWGKHRRRQRVKAAEDDRRNKILAAQEQWAKQRLIEAEKAKWVAKIDPFTDKVRHHGGSPRPLPRRVL